MRNDLKNNHQDVMKFLQSSTYLHQLSNTDFENRIQQIIKESREEVSKLTAAKNITSGPVE